MPLVNDDCLSYLRSLPANLLDSLVTDPPAGISFMGKEWDHHKGGRDEWVKWMTEVMDECRRVLKPGAHGLVWAIPRTSHWTATALENAGFEVRDVITHLFGSGFPKSLDISKAIDKAAGAEREVVGFKPDPNGRLRHTENHAISGNQAWGEKSGFVDKETKRQLTSAATEAAKQWQGWGTALKPASEHWILIRKPIAEKTVAANVLEWGTGGINIDASRIETNWDTDPTRRGWQGCDGSGTNQAARGVNFKNPNIQGRFPANLILDEEAAAMLDEQSGVSKSTSHVRGNGIGDGYHGSEGSYITKRGPSDSGGASRFFYCAKASKSERGGDNKHPTVKPQKLMQYLIRLITPEGGTVLDPFMGSGSTGVAARDLGFKFVGIEREAEYFEIAKARVNESLRAEG